jgi:hypothetical protein
MKLWNEAKRDPRQFVLHIDLDFPPPSRSGLTLPVSSLRCTAYSSGVPPTGSIPTESDEFINELVTQDTNGQPALVLAALMKGHHLAAEQSEQSHKRRRLIRGRLASPSA